MKRWDIKYTTIGVIHTRFINSKSAPIQGVFAKDATGEVELFPEYTDGLKDLDSFSHIILIYHFHLSNGFSLISQPFLEDEEHGIFSIRHFNRPNPIGLSVVKLNEVEGNVLHISEVDILNGTPLLDIKPLVPLFDDRPNAKGGWTESDDIDLNRGKPGKHRSE